MEKTIRINFTVTPSQKETIDLRVSENGFDDVSAYIKVVALKTDSFNVTPAGSLNEEPTVEIGFDVTQPQKSVIEEKAKASGSKDVAEYLQYVALHAVISSTIEIRSTGSLDDMLKRIADSKKG